MATTMSLTEGSTGRVAVKGRGSNLGLVSVAPVKARVLTGSSGTCFDADFSSATNTGTRFTTRLP